jgi:hypothetical protein
MKELKGVARGALRGKPGLASGQAGAIAVSATFDHFVIHKVKAKCNCKALATMSQ